MQPATHCIDGSPARLRPRPPYQSGCGDSDWWATIPASILHFEFSHRRDGTFGDRTARCRGFYLGDRLPSTGGSSEHQVRDAVFTECHDDLRPRELLFGATLANDGCRGSIERRDTVWSDHR